MVLSQGLPGFRCEDVGYMAAPGEYTVSNGVVKSGEILGHKWS